MKNKLMVQVKECYDVFPVMKQMIKDNELKEIGSSTISSFDDDANMLSLGYVSIHQEGLSRKLSLIDTKFNGDYIDKGEYSAVPYLKRLRIRDLPGKMVRIDQLPKFQDHISKMAKDATDLIKGNHNDQALFILTYAQ